MFKKVLIIFGLVLVLAAAAPAALARQGCCSGHGGVCACECCDGKPLSTVCRQYYEGCENMTNWDDRPDLNQNKKAVSFPSGWQIAAAYVFAVCFILFFGKIKYRIKK